MAVPMRKDDPAYWMLTDGYTSTPEPNVYSEKCYICNDPEFAQMGLPLCKACPECKRKNEKVEQVVDVWKCKLHPNCWTSNHIGLETIKEYADDCDTTCKCWKHTILSYMKKGPMVGHVPADDMVCTVCKYEVTPEDYGFVYNLETETYVHPEHKVKVTTEVVHDGPITSLQDFRNNLEVQIKNDRARLAEIQREARIETRCGRCGSILHEGQDCIAHVSAEPSPKFNDPMSSFKIIQGN